MNVPVKKFSIMSRQKTRSSSRGVETPGPKVIKLFSSSAQLIMKFQLLIDVEIVKISGKFRFRTKKLVIDPAHKCLNANNCWHFNIYEQDKSKSQLS